MLVKPKIEKSFELRDLFRLQMPHVYVATFCAGFKCMNPLETHCEWRKKYGVSCVCGG